MTQISKLLVAFSFAFTFGLFIQIDVAPVEAQIVSNACGCGQPKCGGCLKGKLFPVKQLAQKIKPKKPCGCASCEAGVAHTTTAAQSVITSDVLISTEMLPEVSYSTPTTAACGCGKIGCGCKRARKGRLTRTRSCPQCDCEFCELKVSKTKDKKKCFEVKQKEVCIPPVRLPWKRCCPPTKAKVRVVNVLSSKSYECPACKYEWKVYEPEVPKSPSEGSAEKASSSSESAAPKIEEVDPVAPEAPKMSVPEVPEIKKLDLETVPRPPVEKGA